MPKGEGIAQTPEILEELMPPFGPRRKKFFWMKNFIFSA